MNNTTVATGVNRGRRLRALVRGTALGLVSVVLGGGHCADAQVQAPADAKEAAGRPGGESCEEDAEQRGRRGVGERR